MPRQARKKSNSGIYHIMLREINGQQLFADSEDYEKFLEILKDCKAISEFEIFAYCLMGNHIHLLLKRKVYKKISCKGHFNSPNFKVVRCNKRIRGEVLKIA